MSKIVILLLILLLFGLGLAAMTNPSLFFFLFVM